MRRPSWTVQGVFDPDGGGKDFAYTIGLDELGHPELHLWARPGLGDDPGDDWKFSHRDQCSILNELAWMLIDGELAVGSQIERRYDAGAALVRFRVDPPGDVEELEAHGVARGALVLPVRWSLHRAPEGHRGPLTKASRQRAMTTRHGILSTIDRHHPRVPRGWGLPGRPTWHVDQRYGPLTPMVLARAAQLWQADDDGLGTLLQNAVDVSIGGSPTWPSVMAIAAARPVGRTAQVQDLHSAVHELVRVVTDELPWRMRWDRVIAPVCGDLPESDPREYQRCRAQLVGVVGEVVESCLLAEAVADVIDPAVLVAARGPWCAALGKEADVPATRAASKEVIAVVMGLLEDLSAHQLAMIAVRHRAAERGGGPDKYDDLAATLRGWALTGPAGVPWSGHLDQLPAWEQVVSGVVGPHVEVSIAPLAELHRWVTVVAAALTYRPRLSGDDVSLLCRPVEDVLPRLAGVLNEPVVASG